MIYVLDTSSFIVLKNFYPARFPSLWQGIEQLIAEEKLLSNREVFNELNSYNDQDFIQQWAKDNKSIFLTPTNKEMEFVKKIFQVAHFRSMISRQNILKGTPVADPFVIASAYIRNGWVVTEESKKPNAAKIPNVCEHFGIKCLNLEGLMGKEGWEF